MINVFVHQNGDTRTADRVEPAWLDPASGVTLWVDIVEPSAEDGRLLADTFHVHPLSIEDALSAIHHPKIEQYKGYLYLILHGIDVQEGRREFATRDVDFFLGPNYLVTVHDGASRSIRRVREICGQHESVLAEGPVALLHRIVDQMVDHYRPEIDRIEELMDEVEETAIVSPHTSLVREILGLKRDLAGLRRVVIPQRDALARLARREYPQINEEMTYRFRDVYDNLVRISEEAALFQDRVTGILDAHLSAVSNRLNEVMRVLTVMSTIFLPLTVLTGMWGMNVPLPHFPGGEPVQFWVVGALMLGISAAMLLMFRRKGWF
ncbi:MAG: magnesium/cobalt transporter CorA [Vicinamibacterales bacterium]